MDKVVVADSQGICSTDILVLKPKEGISPQFLAYRMHLNDFLDYAISTMSRYNHPRTQWSDIKNFKFVIPKEDKNLKIKTKEISNIENTLSSIYRAKEYQNKISQTLQDVNF